MAIELVLSWVKISRKTPWVSRRFPPFGFLVAWPFPTQLGPVRNAERGTRRKDEGSGSIAPLDVGEHKGFLENM